MIEYVDYLSQKNELILKISKAKEHLLQLSEFGIDVSETIKKLDSVSENIQRDALSIVLVGAFSDGKTSVVAGWLNEAYDNMKIDSDESSDEILKYSPLSLPKGCHIVDTPGLFGDKIGNDENGNQIALSDITKKYISEANVVLYVVTAKNPIKDSHKACVNWILNGLNKLSSTIFVINRMDDVVDLTDDDEFELQRKIKVDTLRKKLVDCGVKQQDAEAAKIVCVSAAPDGKGIELWKNHRDEYLQRSRMTKLETAANDILKDSREILITKTGCDVLNDELGRAILEIDRQEKAIDEIILPEKKESLKRNRKDLDALKKRIKQSREDIRDELKKLNKSKISRIRSSTMESFKDMLEDEIGIVPGKEGAVISEEITTIYNRYAEKYSGWSYEVGLNFQKEYDKQNTTIENLLKKGATGAAAGFKVVGKMKVATVKKAIFAARDLLKKLGIVIKFKPWQVVKMATFATKALPIIGAALDVISNVSDSISTSKRVQKFEKMKNEIKNEVNGIFIDCINQIRDDNWFFDNFAPGVNALEEQVASDEREIALIEEMKNKYMQWSKKVKDIKCSIL